MTAKERAEAAVAVYYRFAGIVKDPALAGQIESAILAAVEEERAKLASDMEHEADATQNRVEDFRARGLEATASRLRGREDALRDWAAAIRRGEER